MTQTLIQNPQQASLVNRAIVLAGSARSGTTIAGKLLGSLEKVEYLFEPPLLITLYQAIDRLDEASWKELYSFYLYEDFLLDALAGRRLNMNRNDDSTVFSLLPEQEVTARLSASHRRTELEQSASSSHIAVKLPEAAFALARLRAYYPEHRFLLMHRDANDVINSLMAKEWFSDASLSQEHPAQLYPVQVLDGIQVPYWIESNRATWWAAASALDRSAYYYLRITQSLLEVAETSLVIDYDQLLREPKSTLEAMCRKFGLAPGPLTHEILQSIRFQEKDRKELLPGVSEDLANDISQASAAISCHLYTN